MAFGAALKEWRSLRGKSQMELASRVGISSKHLSYLETNKSNPSREMVGYLCEALELPLRERNVLLSLAGFAAGYASQSLDDPSLALAKAALERLLVAHLPWPALVIDRDWNILLSNEAVKGLLAEVDPELLKPPINILRLSLHPRGLAKKIINFSQWKGHLISRLQREIQVSR